MKTLLASVVCLAALALQAAAPPPANDNFADRIAIVASGSVTVSGVNAKATSEAGDPTIEGDVAYKSVWWTWTAPFNGPSTITTHGSSFDTLLGIFTGTALSGLTSVAENDDANGLYTSSVVFNAVGGVPYAILVAGFNGAGGKVKVNVQVSGTGCSYSLNPSSRSVVYTAGSSSVAVTTTTGCTWSAVSNDSWLTITAGSSGSGSGTVSYSIAANTLLTSRTGTLTVAGLTHTVTQAASPSCTYSISPTSASFSASPVTNSFTMSAGTGCAWTATPNASWLTIQSGASGTGNGTTTYVVATNTLSNSRVGTITVAGLTHTITQAGTTPCTYSISPTSASYVAAGGSGNITISTLTGCSWTASSPVTWITFSTTNGTGNATVSYTVAANALTTARNATLTIAGNSHSVSQAGAACTYALTPTSVSVAAGTSTGTVSVTAGAGCAWTAVANHTWLTITSGTSGSGNGSVGYSVGANPNTATRAGTLTIGGQTFTVNQAAAACTYSIEPTAAHYSDVSATGSIAVTAGTGCAWTAVSNNAFITINSGTPGSGNGTVGYTVAANVTTTSRTGTVTVAGSTFTITQDGTAPCTYGITPSSASYTYTGGSGSVAVTANTGCAWSASSAVPWVTISTPSGSGNGTVPYTVATNPSSLSRNGTLTIAGNPFTVTQTGAPCTYSTSPVSATYPYTGGTGSIVVTATSGCSWTSSDDSAWLTVTSGATGTGNGTLTYTVAASTASTNRTGRLTVAGRVTTITQTAAPCVADLDPTGASFDATGGGGIIALTESDSACAWTATDNQTWITVSPSSGTGNANLTYTVAPTSVTATRSGTITIAGQTFLITQTGDTEAPANTITAPSNGSTVSNVITLSATASDNVSVSRVDFYYDSALLAGTDTTTPYAVPFNTTNIANGSHTFYARAFDPAGNQGFSATNTVTVSNASAPTNQWAQRFGGTANDSGLSAAIDSSGNVILAGYFSTQTDLGGGVLTSAGNQDAFVAKYTPAGAFLWAKQFGSVDNENSTSVKVDSAGNVIVVGFFNNTVNFGGGPLVSAGLLDIFVAQYSSTGVFQWAHRFGSTSSDIAYGVAIDSSDNVIMTGFFTGTVNFGGSPLTSVSSDSFIAKFSPAGAHIWSKNFPSSTTDTGRSIAVDGSGNVVITGWFQGAVNFGGGSLVTAGSTDVYLARFNSSGTYQWAHRFGSSGTSGSDAGLGIVTDSGGNVIMTGYFTGLVDFGGGILTCSGPFDAFLAKYNSAGSHVWSKRLGGTNGDEGHGVGVDSSDNVLITGQVNGAADFGGGILGGSGNLDIFVAKYSPAGVYQWARRYGGSANDAGYGIVAHGSTATYATGYFQTSAFFNGTTLVSAGGSDIVLIKGLP